MMIKIISQEDLEHVLWLLWNLQSRPAEWAIEGVARLVKDLEVYESQQPKKILSSRFDREIERWTQIVDRRAVELQECAGIDVFVMKRLHEQATEAVMELKVKRWYINMVPRERWPEGLSEIVSGEEEK